MVFVFSTWLTSFANAQEATVRIPLKILAKPAYDLVDTDGKALSMAELKEQFDKKMDLSKINPLENKYWQNTDLTLNTAIDKSLHQEMPSQNEVLIFDSFVGAVRELGMYAINVRGANNPSVVYGLKSGLHVHASLLKAALLRKIGIYQESPKYLQSIKLKFKDLIQMNDFIKRAFCVDEEDKEGNGCLHGDLEKYGFLSQKNETDFSLMVHGSYLEKMNAEVPNLFDGITLANENTIALYAQYRAYRALIVPYVIADIRESINKFSPQSVAVRGGWAFLNYTFSSDFNNITSYDDVRWILRKMSELTEQDWTDIVLAASYPPQLTDLVKAKLLHRYNNMMETFFSKSEKIQLMRVEIPSLKINSGDGVVVDGKVMTHNVAGYPQRFTHGERKSPFESGDFFRYLKMKAQSLAIETALVRLSDKLQIIDQMSQKIIGVEVGPSGVRPLVDAEYATVGINVSANRMVTTGTYYGSQAAVQLVDSLTVSGSMGYVHILDGLSGVDTAFGGGLSYTRNFTHVVPISSMDEAKKISWKDLYIPSKLKKLTSPLKDGKLADFLNALKVGEVFTITDSVGLSGRAGLTTAIDALIGLTPLVQPTVGLSADVNSVTLRQIQFIKTNDGLQVYIRDQNNKAFGLEFNANYFINLLKIRSQNTKMDMQTRVYLLNYNAPLVSETDSGKVKLDEELQKKVDQMKSFGNKAALALRALLRESNDEALAANFKQQMFQVDHKLNAHDIRIKFLWYKASRLNEEHLLQIKKPEVPTRINGVQVVNEPIKIVTYKKSRMQGSDKFSAGLELSDAYLKERYKKNSPASLMQSSQNPSQMPFGKARWTLVRSDTELTQNRTGALPSVAVIEHVWSGWDLKKSEMNDILNEVKEKTMGINFADYPLISNGALDQVNKVDFYRVTEHLSVLPEGIKKIKDLMLSVGAGLEPLQKRKFLARLFQKLSEKIGDKAASEDAALFKNLINIVGNGDEKNGREIYMRQCENEHKTRNNGESVVSTNAWLNGTNYSCLGVWMEKLIKLSRDYPANNLRKQNKWMANVLYVLDEYIPLARLLNYLGPDDKFIYYLEVTGFRSGDEDGADGVYVSNVYGEPAKKHTYANGLISVLAEKSKISVTELDQTTGGY